MSRTGSTSLKCKKKSKQILPWNGFPGFRSKQIPSPLYPPKGEKKKRFRLLYTLFISHSWFPSPAWWHTYLPTQSTYLQFIVDFLHFGSLGEIFVQIEKVLELKLGQRQRVALPRGQSGNVEGLLHAPSLGLVGGERFDDAIIGQRTERKQTRAPGPRKSGREREKITNKLVTHNWFKWLKWGWCALVC